MFIRKLLFFILLVQNTLLLSKIKVQICQLCAQLILNYVNVNTQFMILRNLILTLYNIEIITIGYGQVYS